MQASCCSYFSCCGAQALGMQASVVAVHQLSCHVACGIFPDQESNLLFPPWQVDSYPLRHQQSPRQGFILFSLVPRTGSDTQEVLSQICKISHTLKFSHLMFMQSPTVTTVAHTHTSSQAHVYTHTHTHTHTHRLYKHSWFPLTEPPSPPPKPP